MIADFEKMSILFFLRKAMDEIAPRSRKHGNDAVTMTVPARSSRLNGRRLFCPLENWLSKTIDVAVTLLYLLKIGMSSSISCAVSITMQNAMVALLPEFGWMFKFEGRNGRSSVFQCRELTQDTVSPYESADPRNDRILSWRRAQIVPLSVPVF